VNTNYMLNTDGINSFNKILMMTNKTME